MHQASLRSWLRRFLASPASELSRWQRLVRYAIELTRHCAGELRHDKAGQMAAALTYHTLFSLLPIFALMLVALNSFVGPADRAHFKEVVVNWAVDMLESESSPESPSEAVSARPADGFAPATAPTGDGRRAEFDSVRRTLDQQLQEVLSSIEKISFRSIGLVGVLLFIYGATGLLATAERSFNAILGFQQGRPWYLRLPLYYTVLTLGPIVLLSGQWAQGRFIGALEAGAWTNWLVTPAVVAAPLATTWLAIFFLYTLLPTAPVSKRAATIASLVVAGLLVASRELFRAYAAGAAVTTLYGALALLPLFLLFLWWMWLMVLFGLELTYTLGAMRGRRFKRDHNARLAPQLVSAASVVPLSAHLAQSFRDGRTTTVEELEAHSGLPADHIEAMLEALQRAGIAHQLATPIANRYTLARPAERVSIATLLDAVAGLTPPRPSSGVATSAWSLVDAMSTAAGAHAGATTLADVIDTPQAPSPTADPARPHSL